MTDDMRIIQARRITELQEVLIEALAGLKLYAEHDPIAMDIVERGKKALLDFELPVDKNTETE